MKLPEFTYFIFQNYLHLCNECALLFIRMKNNNKFVLFFLEKVITCVKGENGEICNILKGLCFGYAEIALLSLPHFLSLTKIAFIRLHFNITLLTSQGIPYKKQVHKILLRMLLITFWFLPSENS